ncbi:alpha/beta hydrolase family protein, partial [Bacteroidota bacterium]
VTGNIYKPEKISDKCPAILSPHGHWGDADDYGRYREDMQRRCASLAKMGAIVFAYDMNGYGESIHCDHKHARALQIQTWNSMRIVDYLCTLKEVDNKRIAITGASGGATQAFMLTAIDKRIAVSVPVVQISAHFFGGCVCESGMPIHINTYVETNNVEIAALAAPRPMLIISDGDDWTKNTPEVEFPYLQRVYRLYNKANNVENIHLRFEKHDYGFSKRKIAYKFLAHHLHLDINKIKNNGEISEGFVSVQPYKELLVFNKKFTRPINIVIGNEEVDKLFSGKLK